ncbi:MAG TPA: hypothetical protein VIQ53_23005, partial [Inquilinus sp.]
MTAMLRCLPLIAAAWAVLCLGGAAARAGGLEVAPLGVDFAPGQMAQTITVANRATAPTTIQVRTFDWSQPGGADRL